MQYNCFPEKPIYDVVAVTDIGDNSSVKALVWTCGRYVIIILFGAFEKLRKETIRVMYVRLSVRMKKLGSH